MRKGKTGIMQYKSIRVQAYDNRLFAYCDNLFRMSFTFGEDGAIDTPVCVCSGRIHNFADDDTVYLLDTDKVRNSIQRIASLKRKHL